MTTEPDHGPTGPAALARRCTTVAIAGESTGSASPGRATLVRRVVVQTVYDGYHAAGVISEPQHAAAERLANLRHTAGLGTRVCGRYGEAGGRSLSADDAEARDDYHAAMRLLTGAEQFAVLDVLCGTVLPVFREPTLRAGLDALVREWEL